MLGLGVGLARQAPALSRNLALLSGTTLDRRVTFSRPSGGSVLTSAGEVASVGPDVPRWAHDPTATVNGPVGLTNHVYNARGEGAAAWGAHILPAGWSVVGTSSFTMKVVGEGYEGGIPYVDLAMKGDRPSNCFLAMAPVTGIAAEQTQTWSFGVNLRLISGGFNGLVIGPTVRFRDVNGNHQENQNSVVVPDGRPLREQRASITYQAGISAVANVTGGIAFTGSGSAAIDFVLRVSAPMLTLSATDQNFPVMQPPGIVGPWTEQLVVNYVQNPRAEGGGPGVLPPGWSPTALASTGLSASVDGVGVEGGIPYVDYRVFGVAALGQTGMSLGAFLSGYVIPAAAGDVWTQAVYLRVVRGSLDMLAPGSVQLRLRENTASGSEATRSGVAVSPTGAPLASQRYSITRAFTHPDTRGVGFYISWGSLQGVEVDFVLRVGMPGLFRLPFDPGFTPLPPAGQPGRSGNLRCLGLLVEEQRTNAVRNPCGEGGTPGGSLPTYWQSFNVPEGLALAFVGTGTEDGLPYVDMRISGTPTGSNANAPTAGWSPDATTTAVVAAGEEWTASVYARLVAGDLADMLFALMAQERSGALPESRVTFRPTCARLAAQRFEVTRLVGTSGHMWAPLRFAGYTAGVPVDVTLRVAAHQLEKGGAASTPILPPAGAPGVATRAEDVLTVARSALPAGLTRGALNLKWRTTLKATANHLTIFTLAEAGQTRRYAGFVLSGGSSVAGRAGIAGTPNLPNTATSVARDGTLNRYAYTWGPENAGHALNGGEAHFNGQNGMVGLNPVDGLRLFGAANSISMQPCIVEAVTFQPKTLTAAELQAAAA